MLSFYSTTYSQGSAARFVLIEPSANLNGMAGSFAALPTLDPFGYHSNPAQLGFFSQSSNLAFQYQCVDLYPKEEIIEDNYFKTYGYSLGLNFKNTKCQLPFSLGFGYLRGFASYGENFLTDDSGNILAKFNSKEWYDAISVGIGINYIANLYLGFTYKDIKSDLAPLISEYSVNGEISATDVGSIISFPIDRLYSFLIDPISFGGYSIHPDTEFSFGIAMVNIGDEFNYSHKNITNVLPRLAKMGYGISLGLNLRSSNISINLFKFEMSGEARDFLVKSGSIDDVEYQSFPGDIDFSENILRKKPGVALDNVSGYSLEIFESIKFCKGKIKKEYDREIETYGFCVRTRGISKYFSSSNLSRGLKDILRHFDLIYSYSSVDSYIDIHDQRTYNTLSITMYGY
jgi:hypothetical protein